MVLGWRCEPWSGGIAVVAERDAKWSDWREDLVDLEIRVRNDRPSFGRANKPPSQDYAAEPATT